MSAPVKRRPKEVKAADVAPTELVEKAKGTTSRPWFTLLDGFLLALFTALSFATRFHALTEPPVVLFDEVHFGKFVNAHLTGHFYFDIHPPLVKLLMAGLIRATTNYTGDQPFENIGEAFLPTTPVWIFRFIPALAGSLIVPVVFLITKRLHLSVWASILCTSMVCFDNLLLGESREILTDTCLILFIVLAVFSHLSAEQQALNSKQWDFWTLMTGISLGCAISTKWTSLSVFGIVGVSTVWDLSTRYVHFATSKRIRLHVRDFSKRLTLLLGVPVVIYVVSFILYFWTLPKSGAGDPFMPREFQASLIGSKVNWKGRTLSFSESFWALNFEMFRANKNVATPHHWQSYWHTWPFNIRGIACWNGPVARKVIDGHTVITQAFVYLLGNPFVWWFSTFCLFVSPIVFYFKSPQHYQRRSALHVSFESSRTEFPHQFQYLLFQLYLGWVASILPYALISRACFIYHYMPSLIFAVLISGLVLDTLITSQWVKMGIVLLLVAAFAYIFWFFLPFSYGTEMTVQENRSRRWFDSWN